MTNQNEQSFVANIESQINKETEAFIEKYVPKKHKHKIAEAYKDSEGWWIWLADGFISTSTEGQTIHEYTIADVKKEFKTIVEVEVEETIEEEEIVEVEEVAEAEEANEVVGEEAIDAFLAEWKKSAVEYYTNLRQELETIYATTFDITAESLALVYHYAYERKYSDERIAEMLNEIEAGTFEGSTRRLQEEVDYAMLKDWSEEHPKKDIEIVQNFRTPEALETILDGEVAKKKASLIKKVEKRVGNIVDASDLHIGANHEINGTVIGDKDSATVTTIFAGGYNVQRLHYRVIVK